MIWEKVEELKALFEASLKFHFVKNVSIEFCDCGDNELLNSRYFFACVPELDIPNLLHTVG